MAGRPTDVAHGACRQAGQRNCKFTKNKPNVGRLAKKLSACRKIRRMVFFHDNTGAAAQYGPSDTAKTAIQRGETGLAAVTNGPFGRAIKQDYANTLALSALTSGAPSWP